MTDFSIGVDIETNSRFKDLNRRKSKNLLTRVFTEKEMNYCFSKQHPPQHLAARFAGKEAVIKALRSAGVKDSFLKTNNIEIINNTKGVPIVSICNDKLKKTKILVSLSHCEDKAIAFAFVILY